MSQTLPLLPTELFEDIIRYALDVHPARHAIPCVNVAWAELSLPILHSRIRLTSPLQLNLFSTTQAVLRCASGGREVDVRLPGGTEAAGVWAMIYQVLARCQRHVGSPTKSCCRGVRVLQLCLNSHLGDPNIHLVREALGQVNPDVFSWSGPDPDHHFSTAIVARAASELCLALHTWTSLRRLELASVSFPDGGRGLVDALHGISPARVVIRQAVFMSPLSVLAIALGVPALRELRLVDVYQHSIWGPRMRVADVEALLAGGDGLARVRDVVRCVAENERLIGGDRERQV